MRKQFSEFTAMYMTLRKVDLKLLINLRTKALIPLVLHVNTVEWCTYGILSVLRLSIFL